MKGDGALEMWTSLERYLPLSVCTAIRRLSPSVLAAVQEVRLRAGEAVRLSTADGDVSVAVITDAVTVEECFWRLCGQAVHTHTHELCEGFVTTPEGLRVGIAGTAVLRDGAVYTYRAVTSLCIRVVRPLTGAAAPLRPFLTDDSRHIKGLLLCGAPASGKTTLLRDIAEHLSERFRVTVVDERSELFCDRLSRCDVLRGCPKAQGILQAVRSLAPDVVIADELGGEKDWNAVEQSVHCGVPLVCSAHIGNEEEARRRRVLMQWLERRAVDTVVFLPPRSAVYEAARIWKVEDFLENRGDRVFCVCLRGDGHRGGTSFAAGTAVMGSVGHLTSTLIS